MKNCKNKTKKPKYKSKVEFENQDSKLYCKTNLEFASELGFCNVHPAEFHERPCLLNLVTYVFEVYYG